MMCDRCKGQEATVHVSTLTHNCQTPREEHFCQECAGEETYAATEPPAILTMPPVTSLSKRAKSSLAAIHDKLAELDPILLSFCANRGYTLRAPDELWPSKLAHARDEIDRCLHLRPDVSFLHILEKGFYPEMPWALEAKAMLPRVPFPTLTINIFRALPFSALASMLEPRLEEGFSKLRELTLQDIMTKPDTHRARPAYP
jgi:hypothetical protein